MEDKPRRAGPGRKHTIFVMEDSACDRALLQRLLRQSSHVQDVHFFSRGEELLRHMEEENYYYDRRVIHGAPALILLDVYSPGVNGFEVLKILKEHPMTKDIPVIVMTGDMSSDMRAAAMALQASAYMLKPLCLESLHSVMLELEKAA